MLIFVRLLFYICRIQQHDQACCLHKQFCITMELFQKVGLNLRMRAYLSISNKNHLRMRPYLSISNKNNHSSSPSTVTVLETCTNTGIRFPAVVHEQSAILAASVFMSILHLKGKLLTTWIGTSTDNFLWSRTTVSSIHQTETGLPSNLDKISKGFEGKKEK